jgi:S1-C subfamily serine protease
MRWARLLIAGAVLVTGFVQPAPAQEEKEREECVCPERWESVRVFPRTGDHAELMWFGRRARLGVFVNTEANAETDVYGALITEVTEDGPADKAGLKKGDVITKLDGESLLSGGEVYDEDESAPGMRLIERAGKLERGDTVEVEYRRDGDVATTQLVAGSFADHWEVLSRDFGESGRLQNLFERAIEIPEVHVRAPQSFAVRLGASIPGLELVSLNPELGEYFGAEEGVLVISVPEESELNLRAGDIIKAIDGREVKSPSHAMRILRSYEADEAVTFEVLRKKKTTNVEGKVAEPVGMFRNILRIEEKQ